MCLHSRIYHFNAADAAHEVHCKKEGKKNIIIAKNKSNRYIDHKIDISKNKLSEYDLKALFEYVNPSK